MKKLVCLAIALVMVLGLAACASAEFKFERKIDLVCPWGVGGGADSTLRPMATLLQDILGVPVEVVNVEGGSGVNGVEYTYKQPADGYTYMLGTQSLYIQDMLGNTSMDFKTEFECEDVLVLHQRHRCFQDLYGEVRREQLGGASGLHQGSSV